ncbi:MAG: 6,7-dimethyl-8-ribityllumazine synthase [Burkholderiales bacterium]
MQDAERGNTPELDGRDLRIGVVQARFNLNITETMAQACVQELIRCGVNAKHIKHITVPGALEVPVVLMGLADSGDYDALIALGCIIRGETYHFELVANESGAGINRVALDHVLPVANAILTVENEEQAWARAAEKAQDAARVAIEMATLMEELS